MQKDIHPKVNNEAVVTCACGNTFTTISTLPQIKVEICSACHPFYTGQQKFVDTERRIEQFEKRMEKSQAKQDEVAKIRARKAKPTEDQQNQAPKSLKEMLEDARNQSSSTQSQ